jgi:hypothetical protein
VYFFILTGGQRAASRRSDVGRRADTVANIVLIMAALIHIGVHMTDMSTCTNGCQINIVHHVLRENDSSFQPMAARRDTLSDVDFYGSTFNFVHGATFNFVHSSTFNNVGGNQHNIVQYYPTEQEFILAQLRPADRSDFYVSPCMPGTRRSVVDAIFKWLDDTEAPNILWLSGSPGVGKSAVASTVSELVTTRLVSSFFCRRDHTVLCDPAAIWRTVAYDFAQLDSVFAGRLIRNLKAGVDPTRPDVMLHFERLIKEPLMESWKKSGKSDVPGMSVRICNRKALMNSCECGA